MQEVFKIVSKTTFGFEQGVAKEFENIGLTDIEIHNRAVSGKGGLKQLYALNYCSRLSLRILVPILTCEVNSQQQLYDAVLSINWTKYLGSESKIAIDSSENQSEFNNTMFISMKAKDAIVDQLRTSDGIRPSVDIDNPDLRINIHIFRNQCTISLDSSGHSLHKRGYRTASVKAPLNEVLAAGLIYLSGWDGKTPFIDPMCGSGTIAIEACMLAKNIPAGYFTDGYNFFKWNNFNKQLWLNVVEQWNKKIKDIEIPIIAIDLAESSIEATKENVEEAGLTNEIKIIQANFMDYENTFNEGVLIINPPYGERLSLEDVQEFYKQIGDTFKQKYKGMSAYIITSNPHGYKSIGLKTSRKMIVFNGGVECRYLKYEMYDGTKKIKIHDSIQTN